MAHGVSRVLIAKAQRNSTRGAFLSGFMASGFAAPKSWGMFGGTMATAVVAGTVSQTTGGKFANGAISGSFIHMYNAWFIPLISGAVTILRVATIKGARMANYAIKTSEKEFAKNLKENGYKLIADESKAQVYQKGNSSYTIYNRTSGGRGADFQINGRTKLKYKFDGK